MDKDKALLQPGSQKARRKTASPRGDGTTTREPREAEVPSPGPMTRARAKLLAAQVEQANVQVVHLQQQAEALEAPVQVDEPQQAPAAAAVTEEPNHQTVKEQEARPQKQAEDPATPGVTEEQNQAVMAEESHPQQTAAPPVQVADQGQKQHQAPMVQVEAHPQQQAAAPPVGGDQGPQQNQAQPQPAGWPVVAVPDSPEPTYNINFGGGGQNTYNQQLMLLPGAVFQPPATLNVPSPPNNAQQNVSPPPTPTTPTLPTTPTQGPNPLTIPAPHQRIPNNIAPQLPVNIPAATVPVGAMHRVIIAGGIPVNGNYLTAIHSFIRQEALQRRNNPSELLIVHSRTAPDDPTQSEIIVEFQTPESATCFAQSLPYISFGDLQLTSRLE